MYEWLKALHLIAQDFYIYRVYLYIIARQKKAVSLKIK